MNIGFKPVNFGNKDSFSRVARTTEKNSKEIKDLSKRMDMLEKVVNSLNKGDTFERTESIPDNIFRG